jgi:peptidoglycan/LPS O-acetylase OafA/YrhL
MSAPDVQPGDGWVGLAASLVLVVPAMRWRRSSRRFVTWTAAGWLCGGLLCVLFWPVVVLLGSGLPLGLLAGGAVALIGCGVGWGDHEGVHIRDA